MKQKQYIFSPRKAAWYLPLLLLVFVTFAAVTNRSNESIQEISIFIEKNEEGATYINADQIRKNLIKNVGYSLKGVNQSELKLPDLEQIVESEPFVQDAKIYVDIHHDLHIDITQRKPIVRIIDNNGSDYYLDAQGSKIPTSNMHTARVMVATGNIPPYVNDFGNRPNYLLNDLFLLVNEINKNPIFESLIEQIHIDKKGDFILIPVLGNAKIILGDIENLDKKLTKMKTIYQTILPKEGWDKYDQISLKYDGQVVCKVEH